MSGLSGQLGYRSHVFTANTTGTELGVVGGAAASAAAQPALTGFLHTITISADSTANTITVYDGTSTSGTVVAEVITQSNTQAATLTFDIQLQTGLFVVVSGGTTPAVTVTYT